MSKHGVSLKYEPLRRYLVAKEGGYICHYCHAPLIPPDAPFACLLYYQQKFVQNRFVGYELRPDFRDASIDHKVPICRGGAGLGYDNMVLACRDCNNEKGDGSYHWFYYDKRKERERHDLWCENRALEV